MFVELKTYYPIPSYNSYKLLIDKMKFFSKEFDLLDQMLLAQYSMELVQRYDTIKYKLLSDIIDEIKAYFPQINQIPCAIYLNGSFARKSITAGSDLDISFYFYKDNLHENQTMIYQIRYALATAFNINIAHVHSFSKNFITELRQKNKTFTSEQQLIVEIKWNQENKALNISYPINQMMPEREICEFNSIKDWKELQRLIQKEITICPQEWMYTFECIHNTNKLFDINTLLSDIHISLNYADKKQAFSSIYNRIHFMLDIITDYVSELKLSPKINLAKLNKIAKRTSTTTIHNFAILVKWSFFLEGEQQYVGTLNMNDFFSCQEKTIYSAEIYELKKKYFYFRYLLSRMEIVFKKNHHHFEHRSTEVLDKSIFENEYSKQWNVYTSVIDELLNTLTNINSIIDTTSRKIMKII